VHFNLSPVIFGLDESDPGFFLSQEDSYH